MLDNGSTLKIGGETLDLVLTTAALVEICDRYSDLAKLQAMLDDSSMAEKLSFVPGVICILANEGEALKESGKTYSPEWVLKHSFPKDIPAMQAAMVEAINLGMTVEIEQADEDVDEVLAEIEKNAESATGL